MRRAQIAVKINHNKFVKQEWVLWIPAKPYEPHLWIERNWGHTRKRTR